MIGLLAACMVCLTGYCFASGPPEGSNLVATYARHGTTLVALAHPNGIVLAADSKTHSPDGREYPATRKVFRLNERAIAGTAGLINVDSVNFEDRISFANVLITQASKPMWNDPNRVRDEIRRFLELESTKLRRWVSEPPTADDPAPRTNIFVAGYGQTGFYLIYFTGRGDYEPSGRGVRIVFKEWTATQCPSPAESGTILIHTRKDALKAKLMEVLLQKRPCPPLYESLCQYVAATELRSVSLDALVEAAKDAVQYTMDRDPHIGSDIVTEVVEALPGDPGQ